MATETSSTGRDSDKFMLRFPEGMRERIAVEAKVNNRSMNAEIVARLQRSLGAEATEGRSTMELESALDQQRALASEFRLAADRADGLRAVLAAHLLNKAIQMPDGEMHQLFEDPASRELVEWLAQQDRRGAVFSLLQLFDRARPELIETLQNFAGHLEDLELVRSPVVLKVRGREVPTDVWTYPLEVRQEDGIGTRRPSADKVIRPMEGTSREYLESVSGIVDRRSSVKEITPAQSHRGPEPSPNARKRPPKKV